MNDFTPPPPPPVPLSPVPRPFAPQAPVPQATQPQSNVMKVVAIVGGAVFALIVVALLVANLMKSAPLVITDPIVPSVVVPVPSPVTPPSIVPTQPIDLALSFIKSRIFVQQFCNIVTQYGDGYAGAKFFARALAEHGDFASHTQGRAWTDASAKYNIGLERLTTAFYGKYC